MTIDPVALRGTLAHIEAHPEEWDQSLWASRNCRTTYCFAGWACVLAGDDDFNWHAYGNGREDAAFLKDGEMVQGAAARILGLDNRQAHDLFHSDRTLSDLRRRVDDLCRLAERS